MCLGIAQAHSGHLVYNGELGLQNLLFKSKNSVTQKRSVCTSLKFLNTSNMFGKTRSTKITN